MIFPVSFGLTSAIVGLSYHFMTSCTVDLGNPLGDSHLGSRMGRDAASFSLALALSWLWVQDKLCLSVIPASKETSSFEEVPLRNS
ncbi:hypothetical protein SCA6_008352 [Theobroma cacao]